MNYQDIIFTKENGIATMTMNRPERMNAFSPEMTDSMYRIVEDISQDNEVRVLIITGAGRAFCTGAEVRSLADGTFRGRNQDKTGDSFNRSISIHLLMQRCEKPIIASINGTAAGAGLDLALACDIRIASDQARFAELYIRRGIFPVGGGTYFLPRLVGIDKACQLIWTGDMIDAKEAERIGLVTMVVPHDELEMATGELAGKIAKAAPLVIRRTKRAIYEGLQMNLETHLTYVQPLMREIHQSEDFKEGTRAFLEKREPVFKGK